MRTAKYPRIGAIPLRARVRWRQVSCAAQLTQRSDYKDDGTNILLDANENALGPGLALSKDGKLTNGASDTSGPAIDIDLLGLNRYPDP